ncbi:MAG: tetratricopeptide repeat protein [Balneolaceae bacterium]|nr:tetratricopeptide repeat protein [Balneolaceae bacterium]
MKDNLKTQNYQQALEAAEQAINEFPNDPLGYYYKGVVLGDIAQDENDPAARTDYYDRMKEAFNQARSLAEKMEDPPGEIENMNVVLRTIWSKEHNKAIAYATDDSLKQTVPQPLDVAAQHLQNATQIIPDSVLSWNVLSQVQYMREDMDGAITALEKSIELQDTAAVEDYVRLSDYYRVNNQSNDAISILNEAQNYYPENINVIQKLADAYSAAGRTDDAVNTIKQLIEKDPENPQYHLVLGTTYYQRALEKSDSLSKNYDKIFELERKMKQSSGQQASELKKQITKLQNINDGLQSSISELTNQAEEKLKTVIEYRPNDANAYNTLGIIYQNKAATLFEERNLTEDNKKAKQLDQKARDMLRQAMKYYENATEIDPDNKEYWQALFRVYTTLGMDQKAKEAMKKAGLDQGQGN